MPRYYIEREIEDGRLKEIVIQNENGVFYAYTDGVIRRMASISDYAVKLPGWPAAQYVPTTSFEYLEYIRIFERNSYTTTKASEIQEEEGKVEDIVERILTKGR